MTVVRRRGRRAGCGAEFDEVGLVFLVARCDESVNLLQIRESVSKKKRRTGEWRMSLTSPFNLTFSSSVYGAYHLASLVLPCRF
jgi:hypothetical protein